VLFGETLPHGIRAAAQIAAFTCLITSAVFLGRQDAPSTQLAGQALATADRPGRFMEPGPDEGR